MIIGRTQDPAWERAVARFRSYKENPQQAAYDLFADENSPSGRLELHDYQADVARSVLMGNDTAWRSCHGAGKTTTDAIIVFLFLLLNPNSKVPTTAPTWHQVRNVLWTEIAKWYERFRFKDYFTLDKTKLSMKSAPSEWFAIGVASNKPTNIEGFHARFLLFIVDEAKGVANPIYDAVDGACTQGGIRLYTSTPGSRAGKFYEAHHGRISKFFKTFHTNGENTPQVSKKWVDLKREEWGATSSIYTAKVRGEFPQEGDDVMFPLYLIEDAMAAFDEIDAETGDPKVRHLEGNYALGADIARYGLNHTVLIGGSPTRVDRLKAWSRAGVVETSDAIHQEYRECTAAGVAPLLIGIDDTGLGGGVTDTLNSRNLPALPVILGSTASETGRDYLANLKAEMANNLRRIMEMNTAARQAGGAGNFAMLRNDRLMGQLASMRRRFEGAKGLMRLIDPDDPTIPATELPPGMKVSPDHAHALLIQHHTATVSKQATVESSTSRPVTGRPPLRRFTSAVFGDRRR